MAKTMASIAIDFNKSQNHAKELENIANKLAKQRASLVSEKQRISANWKGNNANAFIKKLSVMERDIQNAEKSLKNTAKSIRTHSGNIYRAEKRAIDLAKVRKK